jgi:hypothetical protein
MVVRDHTFLIVVTWEIPAKSIHPNITTVHPEETAAHPEETAA